MYLFLMDMYMLYRKQYQSSHYTVPSVNMDLDYENSS